MARARNPDRDRAFDIFKKHGGNIELVQIAEMLGRPPGTVRGWKNKDNWEERLNGTLQKKPERSDVKKTKRTKYEKPIADEVKQVMDNPDLNDKQRLFCLYYIRSFNATRSYQKAYGCSYGSAMVNGPRLLGNDRVKAEIMKLKEERYAQALLKPEDIFQKYMEIAFADITDFVEFGQEEVPVMAMYGPVQIEDEQTGGKVTLTKMINTVSFKESTEVDGTLISEVKQGRDGASIKLPDRMKALQWLADHMDMATEEQRLKCEKLKAEVAKIAGGDDSGQDDGFMDALQSKTAEVWDDER